jgi:YVTN family beta-propeller protein
MTFSLGSPGIIIYYNVGRPCVYSPGSGEMKRNRILILCLMGAYATFLFWRVQGVWPIATQTPSTIPVKRSSSAIALTIDNTLLVANPDSNSISLINTREPVTVVEISVGTTPQHVAVDDAGEWAYVANWGADTVSVIDVSAAEQVAEIAVGDRPYGLLVSPNGRFLYIAEQGTDSLRIVDTSARKTIRTVSTHDRPSGLAMDAGGETLYISHLLTSTITVLDITKPYVQILPLMQVGPTTAPWVTNPSANTGNDTAIQLWSDSNLVQSIVIAPDGRTAYIPHTRANTSNRALTFDTTVFPLVSLIDLQNNTHLLGQQLDLATLDPPGVGLPFDAAITADGTELWVVNAASNDVTVLNLPARTRTAHIEVGDHPRGIVLSADESAAYVNNALAGTVSVIDTAAYTVTQTITTTHIPLPPLLLEGKRLFHSSDDPRLSKDQWIACNTCHFAGEHDGRTWFFGFAGPRNTTSLLGMVQTYPLRWSGEWDESADGEFAIRKENFGTGLIIGELHCALSPVNCVNQPPNQGRDPALDALAAFMDGLAVPFSPTHAHGEPLTAAEQRGHALFNDPTLGCLDCHPPPYYTDLQSHDVGTSTPDEKIGPAYDTPSLRGLYDSAPYFHDGRAVTLFDALTFPSLNGEHDLSALLSPTEIQELVSFLLALPFE